MSETAVTKITEIATNTLYHGDDEVSRAFLKTNNPRLRRSVKRIVGKHVDNCLHLRILHLFADSSPSENDPPSADDSLSKKDLSNKKNVFYVKHPSNTAAIVVYSENDHPPNTDPAEIKYFTLFYEYSNDERRFELDDIGKKFVLHNFLVVKVPRNRLTAEDDGNEDCMEFDLEDFAIVAGKELFNSTVMFEESSLDDSIQSASGQLYIDEEQSSSPIRPVTNISLIQDTDDDEPINEDSPIKAQEVIENDTDVQRVHRVDPQLDTGEFSLTDESNDEEPFNDATQIGDSDTIGEILKLVSATVKAGMNVPAFLRSNILLVKFEDFVLTSLTAFDEYGREQNTVGIMRRLFFDADKISIDVVDEDKVRKINIARAALTNAGIQELKLNQLLIVRKKETFITANDCIVVDLNDGQLLKLHNLGKSPNSPEAFLYKSEIARVCELMYYYFNSIPSLMELSYPTLFGIVLYKIKHNDAAMQIGLLLSHEWKEAKTSLPRDSGAVYMNQLPVMSKYFKYFSKEVFDELKTKDIFVNLVLYDDPVSVMDNIPVFTSCIFHGINRGKNNDLLVRGEQMFRQGKWIHPLSDDCYFVKEHWNRIIPILDGLRPALFEEISTQMTEEEIFNNGETEFDITRTSTALSMFGPSGLSVASAQRPLQNGLLTTGQQQIRQLSTFGGLSRNILPVFLLQHPDFRRENFVEVENFSLLTANLAFPAKESVFKIPARLLDFMFTANNVKLFNMGGFRRESMVLVCSSMECEFNAPYEYFFNNIAASMIADKTKMPECPRCHHLLKVHITIGLTFSDRESTSVNVMFMSPAVEKFLSCAELLLMYAPPDDRKVVKALDFIFTSLCSVRHNRNSDFVTTSDAAIEQNPLLNLYFRKFELSDLPQERFHPNKELFDTGSGESFVFELMALERFSPV